MSSAEALKKIKDPKFYLENFCKIKTKDGGLRPFILKEYQKDLFNTIKHHNRIMILKARQLGFCLDKNTKVSIDIKDGLDRTLVFPSTDPTSSFADIPKVAALFISARRLAD